MPAKDVIEKAKAAGHKLSPAYVYVIRSKGSGKTGGRGGRKLGRGRQGRANGGTAERQLISAALELGFTRAQEVLNAAKARLQASL
jgi:hypothetical protein